ncbi:hypothetical protein HIM_07505 [Hirsutella minnesotensis 3608]|uniref:Rhodopsin domain-containing protein n=1 Tax=Hirsutella minnesotensis 3608 TaxID=1043627 RepID=A0A0F7ZHS2_9HYPO|nr:hypothetical protein HIM_07505 [Hirsutella minnesotensis 3608]
METLLQQPPEKQQAILNGPALAPPPGVVPNFVDPPNRTGLGIAVTIVCVVMVVTAACLRLYARAFVIKKLHVEDAVGLAAFGCFLGGTWSFLGFLKTTGLLVHQWDVQVKTLMHMAYFAYVYPIFYGLTMLLAKTAILLEWTRIFVPRVHNSFYWACRLVTAFNVCLYVAVLTASVLYCIPAEKVWRRWIPGRCLNRRLVDVNVAVFNFVIDVVILALPQRVIWTLNTNFARKIGVSVIFSVGLLACACAFARTWLVVRLDYRGDTVYDLSKTFMLSYVEMTCVLMVFIVPALPRLFTCTQGSLLSRLLASLHLWTRMSRKSESDDDQRKSKPPSPPTIGCRPKKIGKGSDEDILRSLSLDEIRPPAISILKTTEVEQLNDSASNISTEMDSNIRRQHPWIER